ncbi:outer membrane protein iml2 [Thermoascus aurantiacus ATCC 26904]
MFKVGSWLYGKKPGANASTQSLDSLKESQDLDHALRAATLVLNDDVDGAEAGLDQGNSTYHKLGKGVVGFVRATLGFEQEVMREASERLSEAETSAANDQHRAQHNAHAPNAYRSQIYAPGAEFALCQAIAQLMGAIIGVLNESLTESIKAFYKLRKAYITLDTILQMEEKFIQGKLPGDVPDSGKASLDSSHRIGQASKGQELSDRLSELALSDEASHSVVSSTPNLAGMLDYGPDSEVFSNPIDVFVHSGANLCFGILLLIISMVPPAFSKLLSIIGFRGDKQRGLRMLWQASKFHNLMGAIAALALLGYYNGFVRYCDIIPDAMTEEDKAIEGYPRERLASLLTEMRSRFPKSKLWLLEESRMNGANRNLEAALELLRGGEPSPLKQVEALRVFERSLNAMYLHKYELCSESFLQCVELNSWSRSLYYYIAGASHLALYRYNRDGDPEFAKKHADKATELFRKAPTQAGKKRFMARQLPFDVFVTRKVAKWEARAKEWKVDLVDAVGVDPVEEMIFFWNGHGRMTTEQLEESLRKLSWSDSDANKNWHREGLDEKAILALLRAAVLRALRRHDEAKELLQSQILQHDRALFKGHLKDDWTCPAAHYEMAANLWMERPTYVAIHGTAGSSSTAAPAEGTAGPDAEKLERQKVRECKEYLEKAAKWESYELDARIGLKVTAGMEAIQKWEASHSASSSAAAA